jgi:hypothetical protein
VAGNGELRRVCHIRYARSMETLRGDHGIVTNSTPPTPPVNGGEQSDPAREAAAITGASAIGCSVARCLAREAAAIPGDSAFGCSVARCLAREAAAIPGDSAFGCSVARCLAREAAAITGASALRCS